MENVLGFPEPQNQEVLISWHGSVDAQCFVDLVVLALPIPNCFESAFNKANRMLRSLPKAVQWKSE